MRNIDAKILSKILADQIQKQQQKKKITYYNQESFQVHKDVQHTQVNVIHKKKDKITGSSQEKRPSDKISHPFMIKLLPKWDYREHISANKSCL